MDERKQAGAAHGKNGHGFRGPGDGVAPPGPEQVQDCGDEGARVGDTDPEDEVDEIGAPVYRGVHPRHPDTDEDLVEPAPGPHQQTGKHQGYNSPIFRRRRTQGVDDCVVYLFVSQVRHNILNVRNLNIEIRASYFGFIVS